MQIAEPTPPTTPTIVPRTLNLFIVEEDCAPPKENEGIMFVRKGQIYDVMDSNSDWWLARLVRDLEPHSQHFCEQGWVPGSFLDRYQGHLAPDEETAGTVCVCAMTALNFTWCYLGANHLYVSV